MTPMDRMDGILARRRLVRRRRVLLRWRFLRGVRMVSGVRQSGFGSLAGLGFLFTVPGRFQPDGRRFCALLLAVVEI